MAFHDVSASEAAAVVTRTFPDLMRAPLWRSPVTGRERIQRYIGNHAALVRRPDGKLGFLESTYPLRARGRPIDLALRERGDALKTVNSAAPIAFGSTADRAVHLERAGVTIGYAGGMRSSRLSQGDKAFFGNAGRDTDFFAAPLPVGIETFLALRSFRSPQEVRLAVGLPAGAELRRGSGENAAEIWRGSQRLASVSRPVATDAKGTPVPISFSVSRNGLAMRLAHRTGDYTYPILVDPGDSPPPGGLDSLP